MPSGLPHMLELCQPNLNLLVLSTDACTHACTHPPQCMHTCGDSCVIVQQKSGVWFRVLHQSLCCSKVVTLTVRCPFTKSTHSVQFSCSVVSNCLRPHGLQHTRPPCPSPTPGAYSNSCPSRWWCHPTISSSVVPSSSRFQSFPASGSFQMSQFFTSGKQTIIVSASASVLPMNIQGWCPLGLTGLISCSPRDSQESSPIPQFKSIDSSALSFLYSPILTSIHDYWKKP